MIVGKQKPLDEIWDMIKAYRKILVFGCNTCVAICHEGGNKEAEILGSPSSHEGQAGGGGYHHRNQRDRTSVRTRIFRTGQSIHRGIGCDSVPCLRCRRSVPGRKIPREDRASPDSTPPLWASWTHRGEFSERCLTCGDCILHLTGGICPITRCSKSLMNGPCGGTNNGSCEINPDIPCAWHMIHERLKAQGRSHLIDVFIPPKNWKTSRDGGPRKQIREDLSI